MNDSMIDVHIRGETIEDDNWNQATPTFIAETASEHHKLKLQNLEKGRNKSQNDNTRYIPSNVIYVKAI